MDLLSWGKDARPQQQSAVSLLANSLMRKRPREELPAASNMYHRSKVIIASLPDTMADASAKTKPMPGPTSALLCISTGTLAGSSNASAAQSRSLLWQAEVARRQRSVGGLITRGAPPTPVVLCASDPAALRLVYTSFGRQKEAYAFIDKLIAPYLSPRHPAAGLVPSLKVFAGETGPGGKRRFIVAHLDAFWRRYASMPPSQRHGYELLREDTPVHLYLDIEFRRGMHSIDAAGHEQEVNAGVDGEQALSYLLHRLSLALSAAYGSMIHSAIDRTHIVHLESSSASKFSRHVVVRLPGGARFRDTSHAGEFILQFAEGLERERDDESTPALERAWLSSVWVQTTRSALPARALEGESLAVTGPQSHGVRVEGEDEWCTLTADEDAAIEAEVQRVRAREGEGGGGGAYWWESMTPAEWAQLEAEMGYTDAGAPPPPAPRPPLLSPPSLPPPVPLALDFLADRAVYTRNRAMRMSLSCKWGKGSPLLPAACHAFDLEGFRAQLAGQGVLPPPPTPGDVGRGKGQGHAGGGLEYWVQSGSAALAHSPLSSTSAPPNGYTPPPILCGDTAWERDSWLGSLITDTLPPLWQVRAGDERGGEVPDGPPSLYRPSTHPTLGFSLLYCWPRGGGEGRAVGSRAGRGGQAGGQVKAHRERRVEGSGSPPFAGLAQWVCGMASGPVPPHAWLHGAAAAPHTRPLPLPLPTGELGHLYAPRKATIRSWSATYAPLQSEQGQGAGEGARSSPPPVPLSLSFHIGGSRWCHRIGRHHRANHVCWTVDVGRGWATQSCFDRDCCSTGVGAGGGAGAGYRSPPVAVPAALLQPGPLSAV